MSQLSPSSKSLSKYFFPSFDSYNYIIFCSYIRLRWPVKVNCWFCNKNTKIWRQQLNWWMCPYCEQYNGFSKVNHILQSIFSKVYYLNIFMTLKNHTCATHPKIFIHFNQWNFVYNVFWLFYQVELIDSLHIFKVIGIS